MPLSLIGVVLLVALMIPLVGIVIDSPIGRAIARRLEGPVVQPQQIADLLRKVEILESEVDDLTRAVEVLRDENQFLQRLLEDTSSRPSLPPRHAP